MEVIDCSDYAWVLLRHGEKLLLDVLCSHSFVDYGFTMQLNDEEKTGWANGGNEYISKLASEIQYSAPGVIGTRSPYRDRNLSSVFTDEITAAIKRFRDPPPSPSAGERR